MLTRIALLFSVVWITHLVQPWLRIAGRSFSGRDLILLAGGLFLLGKSVLEIHQTLEGHATETDRRRVHSRFAAVVAQIALIDIVFSLDSVFTAVGLVRELPVMVAAIVAAIVVMMVRERVWLIDWSRITSEGERRVLSKRSRMRSNTTTVSFSE